jgi:hypothetical protein
MKSVPYRSHGKCTGPAWLCLVWLAFVPGIAAQTSARAVANKNDSNPLHQFNISIRALVKRVTPSVVQILIILSLVLSLVASLIARYPFAVAAARSPL